jgi:tRNA-2-methylthio-N6-dimethylallyladenosine synthase
VVQARFGEIVEAVNASALEDNRKLVGSHQRILAEGSSKRDAGKLLGRTDTNKVVHAPFPKDRTANDLAGRFLDVEIESASTWFLDGVVRASQR